MDVTTLLADPRNLHLESIVASDKTITVIVTTTQPQAACPQCHHRSNRLHSRYVRTVADLPWQGVVVRLQLRTRRFFCQHPTCSQAIFCERLPAVVAAHARRTVRLSAALEVLGFALGGKAGARVARALGMATSPDTVLRRVRRATLPQPPTPAVLGVDDWAKRKGQQYGTILVDLEQRKPIDLLPDREASTLAEWLKAHPGVEVISRDRGGTYADGARHGAPAAVQVADRWHLLANISTVIELLLHRHHRAVHEAVRTLNARVRACPSDPPALAQETREESPPWRYYTPSRRERGRKRHFHDHRRTRYEAVKSLQHRGLTINETRKQLGLSYWTVQRFFLADEYPAMSRGQRASVADRFAVYLQERWAAGCYNAKQLYREIREKGYGGSAVTIRRYVQRWRRQVPAKVRIVPPKVRLPTLRALTWLLLKPPPRLQPLEQELVAEILRLSPALQHGLALVQEFRQLLRTRHAEGFTDWLTRASTSGLSEVENFVKVLRRDEAAVRAAFSLPWSNGQVEGQINRLKMIKRQMYGRANFDLLRVRVLWAA
jgi:transposase